MDITVPPDQRWRYALGTLLLIAAMGLAIAACFGVTAQAGTFRTEVLGAKIEGSSVLVLSIVVFVVAGLTLLKAKKETRTVRQRGGRRGQTSPHVLGFMTTDAAAAGYTVNPNAPRLRRFVNISLAVAAAVVIAGGAATTRIALKPSPIKKVVCTGEAEANCPGSHDIFYTCGYFGSDEEIAQKVCNGIKSGALRLKTIGGNMCGYSLIEVTCQP